VICPHCRHAAKFQRWQGKTWLSAVGEVRAERAYYYCPHCRQGDCPWDAVLGLTDRDLTPAATELTTLAGILTSFEEARAKVLPRLAGLRLAESTVERVTEAVGERLRNALATGRTYGPAQDWDWHADADGKRCAYISVDATGVGQQGPKGQAAEGRMAYVGMLYNPRVDRPPQPGTARYLAGLFSLADLGPRLRRQGNQIGLERAERWIALTDGGAGLEDFLHENFPRAECILDFYHAAEHVNELAEAWYKDETQAKTQAEAWCHTLKHEGGEKLLKAWEGLELRGRSAGAQETRRQVTQYVRKNVHRMDYPRYQKNGWLIGSGHVEAACKSVVGGRLKGSGMRWSANGADAVCHLRALFKSEASQWEAFWRPCLN
jgi:hypothetical protein